MIVAALEFPPIEELLEWPDIAGIPGFNKVSLLVVVSAMIVFGFFMMAGRRGEMVPRGVQNIAESTMEFVRDGIIMQTMGPQGMYWMPFLLTMFMFLLVNNLFELVPFIQFPSTARMAIPLPLALLVFVLFVFMGAKTQGLGTYIKSTLVPSGVPKSLYVLVVPIEFFSTFLMRPFSLAVRLFANMLAGHLLLVTFALLSAALFTKSVMIVLLPLPVAMLVAVTIFELLVAVLQAFIFTILTAVYIGEAMNPEH
ncbi:MAG: F0F1 ATP synthase subunit A [Actinomycetota bacterium]|nr:F0F1 ATP synthase subunit A [Actinomycetota bacterium]